MSVVSRSRATAIIPEEWTDARLRFLCLFNPSKSEVIKLPPDTKISFIPMECLSTDGVFDLSEKKRLDAVYDGFTYFRNDDIIVAKITPCFENGKGGLAQGLTNSIGFGTTEFHVLRAKKLEGRYLAYLCRSHPFRTIGKTEMFGAAGQKRVPEAYLKDEFWPIPPRPQQISIADFLDRETARIDALIAKEERLLALLEEKRTALISHAVTKGLDPNAELKESGIEWIGQIPKDWEVKKLKYVASMQSGDAIITLNFDEDEEIPVYGGNGLRGYYSKFNREGEYALIGRQGAHCGNVHYAKGKMWASEHAVVVETMQGINVTWLTELLRVMNLNQYSISAAQPGLAVDRIINLLVPIPISEEQDFIAKWVNKQSGRIDALKTKINRAIELLREKRTALISAAVTGKIKV